MQAAVKPRQFREDLQQGDTADLWQRRVIIGLSLVGLGSMATTSLLQTGVLKHLPDPPLPGFDSDKVNLSEAAYPLGIPDGTIGVLSYAANLPLAAFGGAQRAREQPWLPLLAAAKAVVDAAIAGWYFYQMPACEKAWCIYCLTAQVASLGILALSLREAGQALAALRGDGRIGSHE